MKYGLLLMLVVAAFGMPSANWENSAGVVKRIAGANAASELYAKNCASCHGKDGRAKTLKGKLKHARDLSDSAWQDRVTDERIFNSVMNGKGKMPAFSKKLSEAEIDTLVSRVRALRQ
jgi:mono/diheme cytochrome c family protein